MSSALPHRSDDDGQWSRAGMALAPSRTGNLRNLTAALLAGLLTVAGCGMPHDPEGTFERAAGGQIRIGATESWPWVKFRGAEPEGIEVELVRGSSRRIGATLHWRRGSETELFEALRRAELDLVMGGLKAAP